MLERQILKYLYYNYPFSILVNALLAGMLSSVVIHDGNQQKIFYWLAVLAIVLFFRSVDYYTFQVRNKGRIYSLYSMFNQYRTGTIVTGMIWGALPFVLKAQATPTDMVFTAFVFGGLTSGATTSLGVDRISLFGFLVTSLVPLSISFIIIGDYMSTIMGLMIFLFMIYLMISGSRFRSQLIENVALQEAAAVKEKDLLQRQRLTGLIVNIQSTILKNNVSPSLLKEFLLEIVEISECQYGFISKVDWKNDWEFSSHILANHAKLNLDTLSLPVNLNEPSLYRSGSLEAMYARVIRSHSPQKSGSLELFQEDPRIMMVVSFVGIPIVIENKVIAVIGLFHSVNLLDEEVIRFLQPLTETLGGMFGKIPGFAE